MILSKLLLEVPFPLPEVVILLPFFKGLKDLQKNSLTSVLAVVLPWSLSKANNYQEFLLFQTSEIMNPKFVSKNLKIYFYFKF